jgi:hypothetical protein
VKQYRAQWAVKPAKENVAQVRPGRQHAEVGVPAREVLVDNRPPSGESSHPRHAPKDLRLVHDAGVDEVLEEGN